MKRVSIVLLSSFAIVTAVISAVPDPVANFKTEHTIPEGDKILKLKADVNGDGKNEILLALKSDFEKDKEDHEPQGWDFYIAGNAAPVDYRKTIGTEEKPGEISMGDIPLIDIDVCFVGQITELGKRGILTMRHDNPREGPTINVIYAYTIEGDRLKKKELVSYEDSATPHALFAKYLADDKRTVITPVEIAQ
jgi:hypothetical protein